jgi:hypothetical protein
MDRVHRGTGRARSTSLEEILMMYVKGRMPFTRSSRRRLDTKQISLSRLHLKYPESSAPTGTLTALTRCESSYGAGRWTFRPSSHPGPPRTGRVFHVNWYWVARLRSCTYHRLVYCQHGPRRRKFSCIQLALLYVKQSSMVTSLLAHPG